MSLIRGTVLQVCTIYYRAVDLRKFIVDVDDGVDMDIAFLRTGMREWTQAIFLFCMWYLPLSLYERTVT